MTRRLPHKQPGQSLPLLALMIVVIVGMVGLAVDVGNAYGQQRRVQNVTNAGALAGMNSVIANQTNKDVCTNVQRTMAGNRVDTESSKYQYDVHYVYAGAGTKPQLVCSWNGNTLIYAPNLNMNQTPPKNIVRVQVTMRENVDTYFARVVGRESLTVNGSGNACLGGYGPNVYPLGIPINLKRNFHTVYRSNGSTLGTTEAEWGDWTKMVGMQIKLPIVNWSDTNPGTHLSWLDWSPGSSNAQELGDAFTYPGTLQQGFLEAASPDAARPNTAPFGKLNPGDWIEGKTGTVATLESPQLRDLKTIPGVSPAQARKIVLPMYTDSTGNGSNAKFYVQKMAYFEIKDYNLTGGSKYITVRYLGDANVAPEECAGDPPTVGQAPDCTSTGLACDPAKIFNVEGTAKVNRVWRTTQSKGKTYDIVLVMDTSGSMGWDWNDRESGEAGYQYPRLNDAKKAIVNFVQSYDIKDDPDARIAFVTFSGTGSNAAVVQQDWTAACAASKLANNCNSTAGDTSNANKWKTIQDKANAMTANGYTPGPQAFEKVEALLKNKRTPPAGKEYGQIVLFATDGVFNVCGSTVGQVNCPAGTLVNSQGYANAIYDAGFNMVSGRPVWQAQQVAGRIKGAGASVFVVALTPTCQPNDPQCFQTSGLTEMSSGSGYYYSAKDGSAMQNIYSLINTKIDDDTCKPEEDGDPGIFAEGATVTLTQPSNPTFLKKTTTDSNGYYRFENLPAGDYVVKVNPSFSAKSPVDGLYRKYSRLRNGYNLAEETQASVYVNSEYPDGSTVPSEIRLSMPLGPDGTQLNGCTSGTAAP